MNMNTGRLFTMACNEAFDRCLDEASYQSVSIVQTGLDERTIMFEDTPAWDAIQTMEDSDILDVIEQITQLGR
jgi:hypothetical protein